MKDKVVPMRRPEHCVKSHNQTHHGVLCQVCARKCEHSGKIKKLDEIIRERLDGDNAA